jgi:uncharacterized membrane protein
MKYVIAYVATLIVFVGVDFVWLANAGARLYRPVLGDMLLDKPNLAAAIVFYLLYAAGVVFFAVSAALRNGAWSTAALNGAVLGLVAYATYDLTNQATLRNWSTTLTALDLGWGTALTAASATAGYFVTRALTAA